MKKCKYCISDIDEKAKICPNCRKKQTKSISGKTLLVLFIIFLVLGSAISLIYQPIENNEEDIFSDIFDDKFTITDVSGKVDFDNTATINGKITNNKNQTYYNIVISYDIYNQSRIKIGTANTTIQYINPNETLEFTAIGIADYVENAKISLNSIETD